jgi:hypothetical protein
MLPLRLALLGFAFDLLPYAHLAWLVAWLSSLSCRTWCNIIIIIITSFAKIVPDSACLHACLVVLCD